MKIAILDDYQDFARHLDCFQRLAGHEVRVFGQPAKGIGQIAARLAEFDAIIPIRERTRISERLLDLLPRLRLICQTGKVGPHIDVPACTRRGVVVTESAGYSPATAELTWLLILAATRRLPSYMANLYAGQWQRSVPAEPTQPLRGMGEALAGRTLCIWGFGRIGQVVAGYGKAFGMNVLVHGRSASLEAAARAGFAATPDRSGFFRSADVATLHLRLVEATRACVRAEDLAAMKPTALLVNTSRAELIEPGALVAALRAGRPGLAAVDVYEKEPVGSDEPLLRLPNAICTPHIGFTERMSYERLLGGAFENLVAFAAGTPANVANPEALSPAPPAAGSGAA